MPEGTGRTFALVTGASQGLGRAFARAAAERGFDLLLVALPDGGLEPLARELRARHGRTVLPIEADLTSPAARAHVLAATADLPPSLVVNNAVLLVGALVPKVLLAWLIGRRWARLHAEPKSRAAR